MKEFNDDGLEIFKRVFEGEIDESAIVVKESDLTSSINGTGVFTLDEYSTAKEMAESVLNAIGTASVVKLLERTGLWAWLIFVMRHQLFKKRSDGNWKVGEVHRWYPSSLSDWQKGQRHLVRMPVLLLNSLGRHADHLICSRPSVLPEIREQLTSQQDMFNKTFQAVARLLYYDDTKASLKLGAGGKGPGSPRRLAKVRQQLDVTWDIEHLEPSQIIKLLPAEFERFKPQPDS